MIEYLEQLVEEKKYEEALKEAERVLSLAHQPQDLLVIHSALVTSRYCLGDFQGTAAIGEAAVASAEKLQEWDHFGSNTLFLGVAYSRLGEYDLAINMMYSYLSRLHLYERSLEFESIAWFNLGTLLVTSKKRPMEGVEALSKALAASTRDGNARYAHGVRQALVDAYLKVGVHDQVPRLLAQCRAYLRKNPSLYMGVDSWVFLMKLRIEYALASGRPQRAQLLAIRALERVHGLTEHESRFHLLLARVASQLDLAEEGMGHALAAKICALHCNRPDIEAEATAMVRALS